MRIGCLPFLVLLALLIVAYVAFGIGGVVAVAVIFFLLRP